MDGGWVGDGWMGGWKDGWVGVHRCIDELRDEKRQ